LVRLEQQCVPWVDTLEVQRFLTMQLLDLSLLLRLLAEHWNQTAPSAKAERGIRFR